MSGPSKIEWTEVTLNAVTGCDRVSPGCDHCYALTMANRLKRMGNVRYQNDGDPRTSGPGFGVTLHWDVLEQPRTWKNSKVVFFNSMSDLFHRDVPDAFILAAFKMMAETPQHTYQILTKRADRMERLMRRLRWGTSALGMTMPAPVWAVRGDGDHGMGRARSLSPVLIDPETEQSTLWKQQSIVLPNVWLGVSVESQTYLSRARHLIRTPAAVRFLSCEPLLGPLDLHEVLWDERETGLGCETRSLDQLHWVIAGGESGPGARPCELEWLRGIRNQCSGAEVPFFMKQMGTVLGKEVGCSDRKGHDMDAWPADLRVRAMPS